MKLFSRPPASPTIEDDLQRVCAELRHCDRLFSEVSDTQLIDYCIYRRLSLLSQYHHLLGRLKTAP